MIRNNKMISRRFLELFSHALMYTYMLYVGLFTFQHGHLQLGFPDIGRLKASFHYRN